MRSRRWFFLTALVLNLAPAYCGSFSFLAVGDIPYNATQIAQFTRSLDRMNEIDARFVLHVGDIKARLEPCEPWLYRERAEIYGRSVHPFVVLVGDNEFNDCPDPAEALRLFRETFTNGSESLGVRKIRLDRQSEIQADHPYPEQVRWSEEGVLFVGLNVVGSANNRSDTEEWKARTAAGVAWLEDSFRLAAEKKAPAVVVAFHANPLRSQKGREFAEPFAPVMDALLREADQFEKPVLFIHGDTHTFRWDIPFPSAALSGVMTNLSRLEVFGSPNPHWLEVIVDPESPSVFAVRPHFLPAE